MMICKEQNLMKMMKRNIIEIDENKNKKNRFK